MQRLVRAKQAGLGVIGVSGSVSEPVLCVLESSETNPRLD